MALDRTMEKRLSPVAQWEACVGTAPLVASNVKEMVEGSSGSESEEGGEGEVGGDGDSWTIRECGRPIKI
jgi:hypothetical protein